MHDPIDREDIVPMQSTETEYAWVVTKSYIEDEIPLDDWGKLSKGVDVSGPSWSGPHNATDRQLELAAKEGIPFRMYDDDKILYYSGRCWSADGVGDGSTGVLGLGEEFFGPLEDFGTPNAGATDIKYFNKHTKKWELL